MSKTLGYDRGAYPLGYAFDEEDARESFKALKDFEDACSIFEQDFGERPSAGDPGECGEFKVSANDVWKEACQRRGIDIPDGTDPDAIKYLYQAGRKAGGSYSGMQRDIRTSKAALAGDSALNNEGWRKRFPNARMARRI
jgi:hypothetical protein